MKGTTLLRILFWFVSLRYLLQNFWRVFAGDPSPGLGLAPLYGLYLLIGRMLRRREASRSRETR
jgi:hypothetical protein